MAKILTIEQSLTEILSAPQEKAKLSFAKIWAKIQPLLMIITAFFPKIQSDIDALIEGINAFLSGGKSLPNLKPFWTKVKPFVIILQGLFGKKVRPYFTGFIAFMDKETA